MTRPSLRHFFAFLAAGTIGCSGSNDPGNSPDAHVRFLNAVRNTTGSVQIGLASGPSAVVPFGGVSPYEVARPTEYQVQASDEEGPLVSGVQVSPRPGTHYTLAIVGQAEIAGAMFLDDDPGIPDVGAAFLRIAHGGLQLGPVDAYLLQPGEQVEGPPTVSALDWLNATLYGEFDSGEITLVLTDVGTQDVRFTSGPIEIPSASVRTLFLHDGAASATDIALLVLDDDA